MTAGLLSPTISPVRNFVIAFLVLFLPMRWGTAVLAAYCLHGRVRPQCTISAITHITASIMAAL